MKRIITTIVILVVVAGGIYYILTNNKKKNNAKTAIVAATGGAVVVRTAKVEKKAVDLDFGANGNFQPNKELNFLSENAGRVKAIYVDEGDRVTKGQVLAKVDAEIINTDRETAEASYQNAIKDLARYQSSFSTGGVTQQQLDQAKLSANTAKLRLQASQRRLSDANIKSPITGIVNKRYIEVGAFLTAQGTQLFQLVDVSKLKLDVNVNESQVALLKLNDKVNIKSSVFPNDDFSGKVSFIAALADNSLNFPIEIEVDNNHKNTLKAGMYGTAIFKFPKQDPSISIPRGAFVGSVSSNEVYVVGKGNKAELRKVVAGRILGNNVEILDGLKEGETVITSGQINLSEGTEIEAVK
ncbi:membrane fusion protein (multidrug efflux system) [Pedobacter sp. UYEF25]